MALRQKKSIFLVVSLILSISLLVHAGQYNLQALNRLKFGENPFTFNHMLTGDSNETPPVAIFDFYSQYTADDHSCDRYADTMPHPYDANTLCDEYERIQSFIIDSTNYMTALEFVSSVEDVDFLGDNQTYMERYGGYNRKVQDLYGDIIQGQRFQVDVFFKQHVSFHSNNNYPTSCKFQNDVYELKVQQGAVYNDFIERYGLFYREDVQMGGYYQIWTPLEAEEVPSDGGELTQDQFASHVAPPENIRLISGNPHFLQREPMKSFYQWNRSSNDRMAITYQALIPIESIVGQVHSWQFDSADTQIVLDNLRNTVNTFIEDVGRLWLDPTIVEDPVDHADYVVSVVFESGKVLSANGPNRFQFNGEQIIDISITSQWVAYMLIEHADVTHNFEQGNEVNQVEFTGTQTTLDDSLSIITGLRFVDNWGDRPDCEEILFQVDTTWYDSCQVNSFPSGITNIKIFDQSGW